MKTTKTKPAQNKASAPRPWLRKISRQLPLFANDTPPPEQSLSPPSRRRLMTKAEVCAVAGATFPSIWSWMQAGKFPRSREVGGRSMWLSDEIDAWIANLPVRRLKGDKVT